MATRRQRDRSRPRRQLGVVARPGVL